MSIISIIKAVFSKKHKAKQQQKQQEEPRSITESKDGQNFQFSKSGRRYQNENEVSYILPNDFDELDRIHQQHWMLRLILQSNFNSPVEELLKQGIVVLDSGCGPGTWIFDMAGTYPKSKFYGVDASDVFPETTKCDNTEFSVANIAKSMPFNDNYFDFIHQRFLILGLTSEMWTSNLSELYRVLKPGGYMDIVEPDYEKGFNVGPLLDDLQNRVKQMMMSRGLVPDIALQLQDRLTQAGFVYKSQRKAQLKMNHTDKGGELFWSDFKSGYLGLQPALALFNKDWEDVKVYEAYLNQVAEECKANKTYAEMYIHSVYKE